MPEPTVPDPLPAPTQVPFIAKHPVRISSPEPNVEVAVAEIFIVLAPVLPRERSVPGVVVPMPTLPPPSTVNNIFETSCTSNSRSVAPRAWVTVPFRLTPTIRTAAALGLVFAYPRISTPYVLSLALKPRIMRPPFRVLELPISPNTSVGIIPVIPCETSRSLNRILAASPLRISKSPAGEAVPIPTLFVE